MTLGLLGECDGRAEQGCSGSVEKDCQSWFQFLCGLDPRKTEN